jgi:hypothetical protein
VAVNVVDVPFAGTVTEAGTGSAAALLDVSATVVPPAEAGWFKVTVHVVAVPGLRLAGEHATDDTLVTGVTVTLVVVVPPSVAVTVTV